MILAFLKSPCLPRFPVTTPIFILRARVLNQARPESPLISVISRMRLGPYCVGFSPRLAWALLALSLCLLFRFPFSITPPVRPSVRPSPFPFLFRASIFQLIFFISLFHSLHPIRFVSRRHRGVVFAAFPTLLTCFSLTRRRRGGRRERGAGRLTDHRSIRNANPHSYPRARRNCRPRSGSRSSIGT